MLSRTLTVGCSRHLLVGLGLVGAMLATSGSTVRADSGASESAGLVGAWTVQVTPRDCASGDPLGSPFNSLVSAHEGGTISESAGSLAFAVGQHSAGHGTWTRKGRRTYRQNIVALILFDTKPNLPGFPTFDPGLPISPGFSSGWSVVTHTVVLTGADHLTSSGTNAFYRSDGTVYRTGCSTAVGQRFK